MNFISESQLEENKKAVGERVEDGTVTVDKPLYEILKEQKEKKEAEEKAKFRNLPPKALDEEEMEFLESLEQHRKERDRAAQAQEKDAITQFQTALLSRTIKADDPSKAQPGSGPWDSAAAGAGKRKAEPQQSAPGRGKLPGLGGLRAGAKVGVKVQLKKARAEAKDEPPTRISGYDAEMREFGSSRREGNGAKELEESDGAMEKKAPRSGLAVAASPSPAQHGGRGASAPSAGLGGLVAYGDDDEDEDADGGGDGDENKK